MKRNLVFIGVTWSLYGAFAALSLSRDDPRLIRRMNKAVVD